MIRKERRAAVTALPDSPSRLIVYAAFDKDGQIDDFVVHSLEGLRPHAAFILVVVNGEPTQASRASLETVADEVLVRENKGFDIGAQRAALRHLGDKILDYDEIVLTNDTWYGPIRPWGPVFARMDRLICDFWGLTDHAPSSANPFTRRGKAPYHLQSYWIAVRRPMFESPAWERYWATLPALETYVDAVVEHELRFTRHFTSAGWIARTAFPIELFDTENPSLFETESLLDQGCPALKRRPLFHWPPLLDAFGSVGAWTLASAAAGGYPVELILRNLARTVPPKAMNVDVGLLSVLPADSSTAEHQAIDEPTRILVVIHSDGSPIDEALKQTEAITGGYDLVVTTTDAEAERSLASGLARHRPPERLTEVRVVPEGASAASALLIGCRDLLRADEQDIIVRLRAVAPEGDAADRHLVDQSYGNLLGDEEYFAAVLALFRAEGSLGIVYPPMLHIGHATLGRSWSADKPLFETLARSVGISVPVDDVSPLAPPGGMFVARISALRLLAHAPWTYERFDATEGTAAAVERMWSSAAGQLGLHTRTAASREYVAMSHAILDYELDQMSSTIPGRSFEKIDFLRHSEWAGSGSAGDLLRMYLRRRHRRLVHLARRLADPARLPGRLLPRRDGGLRRRPGG